MKPIAFNSEQFFEETVLTVISQPAPFAVESKVPLTWDTMSVFDYEFPDKREIYPCRIGYYPVSRFTKVATVTLDEAERLPKKLVSETTSLPGQEPFDGIVVARKGPFKVIGLREPLSKNWQQVDCDMSTKCGLLAILSAAADKPKHKGVIFSHVDEGRVRLMREADEAIRRYRPELTKSERDQIREAWARDINFTKLSSSSQLTKSII